MKGADRLGTPGHGRAHGRGHGQPSAAPAGPGPGSAATTGGYEWRIDQRIGAREPLSVPALFGPLTHRGLRRRQRRPMDATLVDLSVSGASLVAPAFPTAEVGELVPLDIAGMRGLVQVRRCVPAVDGATATYGVMFREDDLGRAVHGYLDDLLRQRDQGRRATPFWD